MWKILVVYVFFLYIADLIQKSILYEKNNIFIYFQPYF